MVMGLVVAGLLAIGLTLLTLHNARRRVTHVQRSYDPTTR